MHIHKAFGVILLTGLLFGLTPVNAADEEKACPEFWYRTGSISSWSPYAASREQVIFNEVLVTARPYLTTGLAMSLCVVSYDEVRVPVIFLIHGKDEYLFTFPDSLLATISDDALQGLIAHELGHMAEGIGASTHDYHAYVDHEKLVDRRAASWVGVPAVIAGLQFINQSYAGMKLKDIAFGDAKTQDRLISEQLEERIAALTSSR